MLCKLCGDGVVGCLPSQCQNVSFHSFLELKLGSGIYEELDKIRGNPSEANDEKSEHSAGEIVPSLIESSISSPNIESNLCPNAPPFTPSSSGRSRESSTSSIGSFTKNVNCGLKERRSTPVDTPSHQSTEVPSDNRKWIASEDLALSPISSLRSQSASTSTTATHQKPITFPPEQGTQNHQRILQQPVPRYPNGIPLWNNYVRFHRANGYPGPIFAPMPPNIANSLHPSRFYPLGYSAPMFGVQQRPMMCSVPTMKMSPSNRSTQGERHGSEMVRDPSNRFPAMRSSTPRLHPQPTPGISPLQYMQQERYRAGAHCENCLVSTAPNVHVANNHGMIPWSELEGTETVLENEDFDDSSNSSDAEDVKNEFDTLIPWEEAVDDNNRILPLGEDLDPWRPIPHLPSEVSDMSRWTRIRPEYNSACDSFNEPPITQYTNIASIWNSNEDNINRERVPHDHQRLSLGDSQNSSENSWLSCGSLSTTQTDSGVHINDESFIFGSDQGNHSQVEKTNAKADTEQGFKIEILGSNAQDNYAANFESVEKAIDAILLNNYNYNHENSIQTEQPAEEYCFPQCETPKYKENIEDSPEILNGVFYDENDMPRKINNCVSPCHKLINDKDPSIFSCTICNQTVSFYTFSNDKEPVREEDIHYHINQMEEAILKQPIVQLGNEYKTLKTGRRFSCSFCRTNSENKLFYQSHRLKDDKGKITCPVLRLVECPYCYATGDVAHTKKYCPFYVRVQETLPTVRRLANGVLAQATHHK